MSSTPHVKPHRSIRLTLGVVVLAAAATGCAQLSGIGLGPERGAEPAAGAAAARKPTEREVAQARESALQEEVARLRNDVTFRDGVAPAIATEQARLVRELEEEKARNAELTERLRTASAAVEKLSAEQRTLTKDLAEARALLKLREQEAGEQDAPAPEPKPSTEPSSAPPPAPAGAPVAAVEDE